MYRAVLHKTLINPFLGHVKSRCLPCHGYSKHTASNNGPKAYPSRIHLLKKEESHKNKHNSQHENYSLLVMQRLCVVVVGGWLRVKQDSGLLREHVNQDNKLADCIPYSMHD